MNTEPDLASRLPTYFLSHGGGPWPWMMDRVGADYAVLDASLKQMRRELAELPRAVLVVTAHWEEPVFTFSSSPQPGMIYDYYNFPPETYRITYPAPGLPELAEQAAELLNSGGMEARLDPSRGFDHGAFSLMQAIYPEAAMPIVQMSVRADFYPQSHLDAGRLLAPLREEGVLIIGSGLSYHNLRLMGPAGQAPSAMFDAWLQDALTHQSGAAREALLAQWFRAPAARVAQPREDHLLPLHVAAGAAGSETGLVTYHEDGFMGVVASSFQFGSMPNMAAQQSA